MQQRSRVVDLSNLSSSPRAEHAQRSRPNSAALLLCCTRITCSIKAVRQVISKWYPTTAVHASSTVVGTRGVAQVHRMCVCARAPDTAQSDSIECPKRFTSSSFPDPNHKHGNAIVRPLFVAVRGNYPSLLCHELVLALSGPFPACMAFNLAS